MIMICSLRKIMNSSSDKPFGFYLMNKETQKSEEEYWFKTQEERLSAIQSLRKALSN